MTDLASGRLSAFRKALSERILLFDGAMGTSIQTMGLAPTAFTGERFKTHSHDLNGNNDVLSLTSEAAITSIHDSFLGAGADIITTNTFNSNAISQADYGLENFTQIGRASCRERV